jgi:hypothetical protein
MKKYKIIVLNLSNRTLTFTVSKYEIVEGDFVEFIDEYTGVKQKFHASRCEIKEVEVDV